MRIDALWNEISRFFNNWKAAIPATAMPPNVKAPMITCENSYQTFGLLMTATKSTISARPLLMT